VETSLAPAHTRVYRALAHHFERFLLAYDERFQATHGYLRRCMEPAVYRYLDCGIFDQGVARIRCPDCRHEFLVAFSCKLRGLCPSCHQKRELLWVAWAEQELLNFHPHVHILVTDGGFHPIGSFHHLPHFNSRHLERLFRAEVLRMLVDKGLITRRRCATSWNEQTAQVDYTARPTRRSGPRPATVSWDVLEFIARVVDHVPDPYQQTTRYWGFYANAARGKRRKVEEEEPTSTRPIPEDPSTPSPVRPASVGRS
jgi:hypothetical protein